LDDDGTILETGQLGDNIEDAEFYNGILVPGFTNSHCHIELSHLKGKFYQGSGMAGFIKQIREGRETLPKEEREEAVERELEHLYKEGTESMADISNSDESFYAKTKSPLYTRTFLEVFGSEPDDSFKILNQLSELKKRADSAGIDSSPTPHSYYTMSKVLLAETTRLALESGYISCHNQESWEEDEMIRRGRGPLADDYKSRGLRTPELNPGGPMKYYSDLLRGMRRGASGKIEGQVLLVHNTFTDKQSIETAKEIFESIYWAICPMSNMFIHRALPPIHLMRREGLKITLGTDSLSSNTKLSMVSEMYTIQRYFPTIPLPEIVKWATINGAEFLKREKIGGSFEPGKRPGVVLIENVNLQNLKLLPESSGRRLV